MTRSLVLTLILAALAAPPAGAAAPQPPPLRPGETLTGHFVQERHLTGLAAPLRSEGRFVLAAGKGLVWHSEQPFDTAVVITPAGLLQLVDGKEVQRLPAARLPFLARLYDMLGGALGGDWGALARDFAVERNDGAAGWTIVLKPLHPDDLGAAPLQSITVSGGGFVDTIEIRRPNGDWDRLAFSDENRSSAPPPADAARLLDLDGP